MAPAQANISRAYFEGLGVSRELARAAVWYQKAARQGDARARYSLAKLYLNGQGVKRDALTAYVWAARAHAELKSADMRTAAGHLLEAVAGWLSPEQLALARSRAQGGRP